jgi:hypothetical protein
MYMNTRKTPITILVALISALCISASACAVEPRIINIPPGELATALETVARQADVELIFQPDRLKGLHTGGVVGMMTAQQAAEKLLEGTRFQLRTDPDNGAMMVGAAVAAGEASPNPTSDAVALTREEEVIVSVRRAELRVMRQEMVKVQDRFYTEYNRLNTNHWWDVLCHWEAQGNHMKARVCKPRFVDQGFSTFTFVELNPNKVDFPRDTFTSIPLPPNRSLILKKWADFEKNMQDQINGSSELRRLVSEREAQEKRYEEARRQKFKGKIVVLE